MNQNCKNFLSSITAGLDNYDDITLQPINYLSVLAVSGRDAEKFLQGQITCDTTAITETRGSIGAYCTAKGRTISTFIVIRKKDSFLLILPTELLDQVKKKLQLYVMRDDVLLTAQRDHFCLFGLNCLASAASRMNLPEQVFYSTESGSVQWLKLPSQQLRFIAITDAKNAINAWTELTENNHFVSASCNEWLYQDMLSGIPWLTAETTEQYIPQMLNLDQLQGISFNKGCYVGQEIVARTHYLGKAKRIMYISKCDSIETIAPGTEIIAYNNAEQQSVGKVLSSLVHEHHTTLLIIVQTASAEAKILKLNNMNQDKITLTEISYLI